MKTWRDLEEASLCDPMIHAALRSFHPHRREEMLITLVLAVAAVRDSYRKQLLDRIERDPAPHHLIGV